MKWPKATDLLAPAERSLVINASKIQRFMKANLEKDWRKLLEIQELCEDEVFRFHRVRQAYCGIKFGRPQNSLAVIVT